MDVVVACVSVEKGGGLEEGGLEIHPGGREADLFFHFLGSLGLSFSETFFRCCFGDTFCPLWGPRVPKRAHFGSLWVTFWGPEGERAHMRSDR